MKKGALGSKFYIVLFESPTLIFNLERYLLCAHVLAVSHFCPNSFFYIQSIESGLLKIESYLKALLSGDPKTAALSFR